MAVTGGRMGVRVLVRLRRGILDAEGAAVKRALDGLGFFEVKDLRVGKVLELELEADNAARARARAEEMCRQLLANPVTEDFTVEIVDDGSHCSGSLLSSPRGSD
ncbi:MAG: phosphoribosylformylglycinamidine synthase subunit PurS [Candidatus Methylomirabilia bacterium]